MNLASLCSTIEGGGLTPHEAATERLVIRGARMGVFPKAAGELAFRRRHLEAARIGVANRLVESLLRERLVPFTQIDEAVFEIPVNGGALLVRAKRLTGFGRLKGIFQRSLVSEGKLRPLDHPLLIFREVLPHLEERFDPPRLTRFALEELPGSVANLALALGAEELRRSSPASGDGSLPAWVRSFGSRDRWRRALEGMIWEGHTTHPCTKTRHGMRPAESIRYSPELSERPFPLHFVALRDELAQRSGVEVERLLHELWPSLSIEAAAQLERLGLDASRYVPIPVHPWQRKRRLEELFGDLLAEKSLVPLDFEAHAWPQLSLRTVEPVVEGTPLYHLKLSIGVQTTSAERTISPQSVGNGPRFSSLLKALAKEANLPLRVIAEVGSVGVEPDRIADGAARARHLAAIVRENPSFGVHSNKQNWLAAALASRGPFSSRSLATELALEVAKRKGIPEDEAGRLFFQRFCQALFPTTLTLLTRYGVALEAHGQNTYIDLDSDGLPSSIAIRDFGGLRIHRETLEAAGHRLAMREGSAPDAPDIHEVRTKFSHCVMQSLLADMIEALAELLPGTLTWAVVREQLRRALLHDPSTFEELTRSPTRAKSLTTMRLADRYNDYLYTEVPNPLGTGLLRISGAEGS